MIDSKRPAHCLLYFFSEYWIFFTLSEKEIQWKLEKLWSFDKVRNVLIKTTETINVSFIIFFIGHLFEAYVIDSEYIKMTGLQDFY